MITVADVAHSIADDLERLGHRTGKHPMIGSSRSPGCVILNPTVDALANALRIENPLFPLLAELLGLESDWELGDWSDRTPTEEVLARLRQIDNQTVVVA